jgi:hypothetical protein
MAEAWTGLGEESKAQESLSQAKALNPSAWMVETTERQLAALKKLLETRERTRHEEIAQSNAKNIGREDQHQETGSRIDISPAK